MCMRSECISTVLYGWYVGMYCMKCEGDYYFFSCQRIFTAQQIYVSNAIIFFFGSQMNCRSLARHFDMYHQLVLAFVQY